MGRSCASLTITFTVAKVVTISNEGRMVHYLSDDRFESTSMTSVRSGLLLLDASLRTPPIVILPHTDVYSHSPDLFGSEE